MASNLKQLALNLCLEDAASFTNFFVGNNQHLVKLLAGWHTTDLPLFIYFWGQPGAGKSHLLGALCRMFSEHRLSTAYLPLEDFNELDVKILDDLDHLDLLCIDDLELIAGNLAWEEKIFYCFNQLLANNKKIVITAKIPPQTIPFILPDLKSRMLGGLIFALATLNDEEKISSLQLRAKLRGLELGDAAARFLLNHYERHPKNLFDALETLDKAALVAQRRLTIPFIKDILGNL